MSESPHLSAASFSAIRELIFEVAGIAMTDEKEELVKSRLAKRLRELKIAGYEEYLTRIQTDRVELSNMVDVLTTNKTSFFREPQHFDYLQEHVFPAWKAAGIPRRIWSAGCSSGEEPYTIAITLAETMPQAQFEVVASDIDTQVLAHAHEGIYPMGSVAALSAERQKRFFLRGTGRFEGRARVRRELAARVAVERINLMDREWPIEGRFDAIFCRNVMIYFDKPTQRRLIERFWERLKPAGLFFAGHAESLLDNGRHFRLRGQTVYVRVEGSTRA